MGTWGAGSFDNDEAQDWLDQLAVSGDDAVLIQTLQYGVSRAPERFGIPEAFECLAAAGTVACLVQEDRAELTGQLPEQLADWARRNQPLPSATITMAVRVVRKIRAMPDVRALWAASGEESAFLNELARLESRLTSALGGEDAIVEVDPPTPQAIDGKVAPPAPANTAPANTAPASDAPPTSERALREQAADFLNGIVPFPGYCSDSETELLIRRFADGLPMDDAASKDDFKLCYSVVLSEIEGRQFAALPPANREYMKACAGMLERIMVQLYGKAERYDDLG